jgi:hypothetical protein
LQLILDEDTDRTLKEIRHSTDLPYVAIVKRAVRMLDFMLDAKDKGYTVQVVDSKGKVVQVIPIK